MTIIRASLIVAALAAAGVRAAAADASLDDRFAAAARQYAAKNYQAAAAGFADVAAQKGADPLTYAAVSLADMHLGRVAPAEKALAAYASGAREDVGTRGGGAMIELKIVSEPFVLFGPEPERPEMLKKLGESLAQSAPSDPLGWELLGYYGLQSADKRSLDAASAGLKSAAPDSALAPFFAGFSATLARDREAAHDDFAAAVRLEPGFDAARAAAAQIATATDDGSDPFARAQVRLLAAFAVAAAIVAAFRVRAALVRPS